MNREDRDDLIPVLLVEDDPDDVAITRRAFRRGKIANPLHVVRDGEEALEFLRRTGRYKDDGPARPGLVLLDLNLPRVDGREVLRIVKETPGLKRIPVVILTTSDQESDIADCYDRGANTYITKPVDFHKFIQAVTTIGRYWLVLAEIPDTGEDR
ncbi:MAG: response regulator [Planctomycetota bacterium]